MKQKIPFVALFLALLAGVPGEAAGQTLELVSRGDVDVSRVFENHQLVDSARFGVPASIAHAYTLRVSYQLPLGQVAKVERENVPEMQDCVWGACNAVPAHIEARLRFRSPEMRVTFELIDGLSGHVVGSRSEGIVLTYRQAIFVGERENFGGTHALPYLKRETLGGAPILEFPLWQNDREHFVLDFQEAYAFQTRRFEDARAELEFLDADTVRLKAIRLDPERSRADYATNGPVLDVDYRKYGHFFPVGAPGSPYDGYDDKFESLQIH